MNDDIIGNVSVTPLAAEALGDIDVMALLTRHKQWDYGDVPMPQQLANDLAMYLKHGQMKSVYELASGERVVILTRWNQVVTQVLKEGEDGQ